MQEIHSSQLFIIPCNLQLLGKSTFLCYAIFGSSYLKLVKDMFRHTLY